MLHARSGRARAAGTRRRRPGVKKIGLGLLGIVVVLAVLGYALRERITAITEGRDPNFEHWVTRIRIK